MALRFIDSFDHYQTAQLLKKWTDGPILTAIFIDPAAGRCGTQGLSVGTTFGVAIIKGINFLSSTVTFGFAFKVILSPFVGTSIPFFFLGNALNEHISLNWSLDGSLAVWRADALPVQLATSAPAVVQNGVYAYVEIKATIDDVAGAVEVRVNGATVASAAGIDTQRGASAAITRCKFTPDSNFRFTVDDFYALDDVGGSTTFLGDCRVEYLQPTAPGFHQAWAVVGAPTHWQAVNDGSSPDDDTTYISTTGSGVIDTEEYSNTGLPSGTIFGVQVGLYARKTDSGLRSVAPVIRHAGVDNFGANQNPGFPDYAYLLQLFETNPGTGVAWTIADVNNAEFGIRSA